MVPVPMTQTTSERQQPFSISLSKNTRVSRYQQAESNVDFTEARDSE